eukprot:Sdes_comp14953_c0_seq1m3668
MDSILNDEKVAKKGSNSKTIREHQSGKKIISSAEIFIPVLTCGLFPLLPKPANLKYPSGDRLSEIDSIDLSKVIGQFQRDEIYTECFDGKKWSIVNVLSPYSDILHVMLIEMSKSRYLPSPESLAFSIDEGERVFQLLKTTVESVYENYGPIESCGPCYFGYNWSPRSLNRNHQRTGFQSIKTKWHLMCWLWPLELANYEFPFRLSDEREKMAVKSSENLSYQSFDSAWKHLRYYFSCENQDSALCSSHLYFLFEK